MLAPYQNEKYSIGAGAIVSNSTDLLKWYHCLRNRQLLTQKSYDCFFSEHENQYGYGLEQEYQYDSNIYGHGGDDIGISTYIEYNFDKDYCIIILANNESINQYRLVTEIRKLLNNEPFHLSMQHQKYELDAEQLRMYSGTYLKRKIKIERIDGKLYFTRYDDNLHIEIIPVGDGLFTNKYYDQKFPYEIKPYDSGRMSFFGFVKLEELS